MFGRLWGEPASAPTRDGGAQDTAADGGADDGAAAEREPAAESEPEPDDAGGDSGSEERDKDEEKRAGRQAWKRVQLKVAGQKTDKLTDGLLDGVSKTLKSAGGAAVSTAAEAKALAAANRDKVMQSAIDGAGVAGMKGLKALSDVVGATTGINVMADDRKEKDARSLFDELDADGSGFLDSGEVEELCKQMGRKLGKKELAKAMAEIDADGNDEVSFSEFEAWWALNGGRAADKRKPAGVIELVRIADVRLVGKKILLQSGVDGQRDYSFEAESKEEAGEKSTSSAVAVGLPPPLYRESCNAHVACPRVRLYVACLSRNLASCSV